MDKMGSKTQQDQVQAIYLAQANIFSYEARKSAKSWVPLCDSTVPISILYDNTRSIYRIISVDAEIKEVVVNTTVIPELEFVKTTQKFGYWKEPASGRVFGIGFASEYEAEAFDECLRKVKQNIGPPSVASSVSLNQPQSEGLAGGIDEIKHPLSSTYPALPTRLSLQQDTMHGQGDGPTALPYQQIKAPPTSDPHKKLNWDDYEQIAPTVFSFLQQQSNRQQHCDQRPSTYKVDLPIISSPSGASSSLHPPSSHSTPAYHHHPLPFPYYRDGSLMTPVVGTAPTPMMPIPQALSHHGYCYQGPPPQSQRSLPPLVEMDSNKHSQPGSDMLSNERRDLSEEINRLRNENVKLNQSLIESTCASKKWEVQVNSLRDDNIQLVKSIADLKIYNTKLESSMKEVREYKEQANRWKEHYQQACSSAKEKGQYLKETEDKLKQASADKSRIESVLKDLEDELKRQQQINKEQQNAHNGHMVTGQYSHKYFKELEDHYRKLLSDSQKKIEDVLLKDGDRKNVLRGVDTLFTGAIQGLINIHGQIRQAYDQQ